MKRLSRLLRPILSLTTPAQGKTARTMIYAHIGRNDEARKLLGELEGVYKEEHISPYFLGGIHFKLGDIDKGFEWLEKACSGHDRYIFIMVLDHDLEGVRSDPRYLSILQRIGLATHLRQIA